MTVCGVNVSSLSFSLKYVLICSLREMTMLHTHNMWIDVSSRRLRKEQRRIFQAESEEFII